MQQVKNKEMRAFIFAILVTIIVLLGGCASKPEIITKVEYQEKVIPVKCNATIPEKPFYDSSDLQSAKDLSIYYSRVEAALKGCVDGVVK
jgi:putative lipoprotein